MSEMYSVKMIRWPYLGLDGAFTGVPVVLLRLGKSERSRAMSGHEICESIKGALPLRQEDRPRWVFIEDEPSQRSDNDLLLLVRTLLSLRVGIATDGREPMNANDDRLPLYEHVVVRLSLPVDDIATQLYHSVVVVGGATRETIGRLNAVLLRSQYRRERYIACAPGPVRQDDINKVVSFGGDWRLTQPLQFAGGLGR